MPAADATDLMYALAVREFDGLVNWAEHRERIDKALRGE